MSKPKTERSVNIPADLIEKLLTESEWRMVKQRYLIMNLLEEGLSIRQIASKAKVGTDTVVRVAKMVKSKKLIPERKFKTSTPWIFGKSD